MTYFRALSGLFAAFNRVATYRKRGKIGGLGCVDVGEKLQQTRTTHGLTQNGLKNSTNNHKTRLKCTYSGLHKRLYTYKDSRISAANKQHKEVIHTYKENINIKYHDVNIKYHDVKPMNRTYQEVNHTKKHISTR